MSGYRRGTGRTAGGLCTALALLWLAGCGGGLKTYPVTGKVALSDGDIAQLAESYVELASEKDLDMRASGTIAADGSFWLQTQHQGQLYNGVPEGTFQARIILGEKYQHNGPRPPPPSPIQARFLDFKKSGLTVQVPPSGDVTLAVTRAKPSSPR